MMNKYALPLSQTKVEEEISNARKLISEKDAELLRVAGLKEIDDVLSFHKKITWYINGEQPIQSMNSMPCYGIVSSYVPCRKVRWIYARVIEPNLIMSSI
ncbi:unnamed protein product [Trifolium pratense]|uniref:Uncharacterized protein n=1 Tax=Trifolium pratense TaxID=57577 RepID=A0ACB0IZF6_TRIPR|nr:unnamed protein product [Trifolium pratense]